LRENLGIALASTSCFVLALSIVAPTISGGSVGRVVAQVFNYVPVLAPHVPAGIVAGLFAGSRATIGKALQVALIVLTLAASGCSAAMFKSIMYSTWS
jgi:hypothetical protein